MNILMSTGARRLAPVFLFAAFMIVEASVVRAPAYARPEDPLAERDAKETPELTAFEKAAKRVTGRIRGDETRAGLTAPKAPRPSGGPPRWAAAFAGTSAPFR